MNITYSNGLKFLAALQVLFIFLILSGCSGEESSTGSPSENPVALEVHEDFFATSSYEGTKTCLKCHEDIGDDVLKTGHWNWQGFATNIEGYETELHGKNDLINNFCIAVPSNEGRCAECHIGYGYVADKAYDFNNAENIDCLVCHDQTGSYKKSITEAGIPDSSVDLQAVATSVGKNKGVPQRANCIGCHANAGGGDNVKHGDLSTALINTTREYDVHMGTDGGNFTCIACHDVKREPLTHGIGGMPFHSVDEGNMKQCSDCHGENDEAHAAKDLGGLFVAQNGAQRHQRLACQVCHIPAIARQVSTKIYWDWSTAGQDIDPIPIDPISGRPTYDKKKGTFEWAKNVRPVLRFHNGKWNKLLVNVNDQYTTTTVTVAGPAADRSDPTAMIYPFKQMLGKQIADADANNLNNKTMLVPHLFGLAGGDHPYWTEYNWNLALVDGSDYTGQTYSGAYKFVDTEMFLSVNHEVAPGEMSLGKDGKCDDCHNNNIIDWPSLGLDEDPYSGGGS